MLIGTRTRHGSAYDIATSVPGMAVVGWPTCRGRLTWARRVEGHAVIYDGAIAPRASIWLDIIRNCPPDYAISPAVGSPEVWEQVRPWCYEAQFICEKEVAVWVSSVSVLASVASAGYLVAVSSLNDKIPSWAYTEAGARVWLVGGDPLQQWRRFCEMSFMGVEVQGIILSDCWSEVAGRHYRYQGSPYFLKRSAMGETKTQISRQSLEALAQFWTRVGEAYGPSTRAD